MACVIMHNMIIVDKRDQDDLEPINPPTNMQPLRCGLTFQDYLCGT